MFYTYHGCHGNIFPPTFLWKMKIVQIILFIIIFKVRIKKKYLKIIKKMGLIWKMFIFHQKNWKKNMLP
jgi:hypothetical protein